MAEDEIERLLREVDASTGRASAPDKRQAAQPPATTTSSGRGRLPFAIGSAVVMGVGAWVFGVFTPWTDAFDMGFAAAGASFVTALVAGPPRWFSS